MFEGSEDILSKIAEWDLKSDINEMAVEDVQQAQIYKQLQAHFQEFFLYFEGISRISTQLNTVVKDFESESGQIEQVAAFLKKGAEKQNIDIQKSMKLVDDFTNKINEIYEKSRNIISLAYDMEGNNKSVNESVDQLVSNQQKNDEAIASIFEVIKRLIDKTRKIGEITKLINRIASETDLLGLNAKVEAVHAGAAGRGFSVVASEIQRLSRESKAASVNISETIDTVTDEISLLQNVAEKSQGIFAAQRDTVGEVSEAFEKNSAFISTYIEDQKKFSSAIEEIKEDEHILAGSISNIFSSVKDISATAHEISSLTFNQNNSIMQLSKLDEDLSFGASSIEKQFKNIKVNRGSAARRKIAVIFNIDIPFFDPPKREAQKAAKTYNYDVSFFAPKSRGIEGVNEMAKYIDKVYEEKFDGLVISPLNDNLILQKLSHLSSSGTKIVFIDSKINNVNHISYIETNGRAAGAAAARVVMGAMGNQGEVIVNTWSDIQIAAIEDRRIGFIEEIQQNSHIHVHEMPVNSGDSVSEAEKTIESMLRKVPDARFIFLTNNEWGVIVANYIRKHRSNIQVITIDFTKEIQNAMRDGFIHFAIGQRAYSWGSMSIDFLDKSFHNKPVKKYVDTGTYEANPQNMNVYKSFIE